MLKAEFEFEIPFEDGVGDFVKLENKTVVTFAVGGSTVVTLSMFKGFFLEVAFLIE